MKKNSNAFREVQLKILCGPMMKKNIELQNEIHTVINQDALFVLAQSNNIKKMGKYRKIFSYLVFWGGIGLIVNSCAGYVGTEPSFIEYERPARPGESYIWIDGGWRWDARSHVYVQQHGYWDRPRSGRSYIQGHWQASPRGKTWVRGHWGRGVEGNEHHDR